MLQPVDWVCIAILTLLFVGLIMEAGGYDTSLEGYSTLNPNTTFASECGDRLEKYEKIPMDYQTVKTMMEGPGVERDLYMSERKPEKTTNAWGEPVKLMEIAGVH
jgi:hypothetical protein